MRVPPPLPALTMTSQMKRAPRQRGHVTTTVPISPTKCANEGTRESGRRSHGRPGMHRYRIFRHKVAALNPLGVTNLYLKADILKHFLGEFEILR